VWDQALDGMVGFWGVDVWDEVSGMGEGGGCDSKGGQGALATDRAARAER